MGLQATHLPNRSNWLNSLHLIYLFLTIPLASGADKLSTVQSLSGDETLLSPEGKFELGFFNPGNSTNYYICIWYRGIAPQTVVWVLNRDKPISDKYSSELKIVEGTLVLLYESNQIGWSANVSSSAPPNSVVAVLLDDGNLVLRDGSNANDLPIWQSFDFPTHTFLPGSKIGYNKLKNNSQFLTSWKNPNDPGTGLFSLELDPNMNQFLIMWNRSEQYWTSGSWNGELFSLVPEMRLNYIYNFSFISNENESYFTYSLYNHSILSRLVLDVSGQIKQLTWLENSREWNLVWSTRIICKRYGLCGYFSTCNDVNLLAPCQCLTGFSPKSDYDWSAGDYSGGCVRKTNLQCGVTQGANMDEQSFLMSSQLKLSEPSLKLILGTAGECESMCLTNCSCTAYAYSTEKCEIWMNELLNIKQLKDNTSSTVYIKLASSDLQTQKNNKRHNRKLLGIIFSIVVPAVTLSCIIGYVSFKRMTRRRERKSKLEENDKEGIDVPFFEFEIIRAATNDFSDANKLGKGGFGPVYKGNLSGGREVAVKRLSSHSGQGLEEFKNEVVLIAKLQHRNLVKTLGYCTKGDEKIVLYEYMPNKSLDNFIFG